jgi:hypothetical protein
VEATAALAQFANAKREHLARLQVAAQILRTVAVLRSYFLRWLLGLEAAAAAEEEGAATGGVGRNWNEEVGPTMPCYAMPFYALLFSILLCSALLSCHEPCPVLCSILFPDLSYPNQP